MENKFARNMAAKKISTVLLKFQEIDIKIEYWAVRFTFLSLFDEFDD